MKKILPIVKNPKAVLRGIAVEVPVTKVPSKGIQELISDMKETLKHTEDGVGLAAPQVGEAVRIFIVSEEAEYVDNKKLPEGEERRPADPQKKREWDYAVFINPVLKKRSREKVEYPEGCLSVPGTFGIVNRSGKLTVEAYDEHGRKFIRGASKFYARVIQHELDHLNGVLFIDRMERSILPDKGSRKK